MTTYRVSFEVELPDGATTDEAEKFIEFHLGARCMWKPETDALRSTDLQSCKVTRVHVSEA